ncbi:F-box protein At2g02240-like isoform X2 [Euphorbia lathyris]|uniref:F-box protein At2g02240-like isoform X2 n=1 Tax=Euphorbia lathyris TaxID=212925 RepID=UPI0033140789
MPLAMENITGVDLCGLPEDCTATIFSFTSPKDVGRFSTVSSGIRSASESDAVWRRFLPSDYQALISQSSDPSLLSSSPSAKDLYLYLADNPILIDDGKKSFGLDKWSGKKIIMLSARDLMIVWGDTPKYWIWTNAEHKSRFAEVAELIVVWWLEIRGKIKATMLSPETHYTAYLVYRTRETSYGFHYPVEVTVGISGAEEGDSSKRSLYLDTGRERRQRNQLFVRRVGLFGQRHRHRHRHRHAMESDSDNDDDDDRNNVNDNDIGVNHNNRNRPQERQDGWLEIELGDYFNRQDEVGDLEISIMEVTGGDWKGGLIIQGIDIRPKSN